MKILGAVLELPAKQHCQSSPFTSKLGQIGQIGSAVQLVCSPKMAPRIQIFSIAMGANYSFYVKSIATFALTFFGYVISVLASVMSTGQNFLKTYVCAVTAAAWRWWRMATATDSEAKSTVSAFADRAPILLSSSQFHIKVCSICRMDNFHAPDKIF